MTRSLPPAPKAGHSTRLRSVALRSAALLSLGGAALACTPTGPSLPQPQDPPTKAVEPATPRRAAAPPELSPTPPPQPGPLEIAWGDTLRKPTSFHVRRSLEDMTDHPVTAGFARERDRFFYQRSGGGRVCDQWLFFDAPSTTPAETLEHGEECDASTSKSVVDRRLASDDFAIRDGDWKHGGEVVLVARAKSGAKDGEGVSRGVIELGARLRAQTDEATAAVSWVEHVEVCLDDAGLWCAPELHIDYLAPSPSGETIAVLLHGFRGEYTDSYPLRMLDADQLALEAFNAEGLAQLRAENYDAAATLFSRASELDLTAWKGPYNLACARALAGDLEFARTALDEAERRGGAAVHDKAVNDPDLAALAL